MIGPTYILIQISMLINLQDSARKFFFIAFIVFLLYDIIVSHCIDDENVTIINDYYQSLLLLVHALKRY